MKGGSRYGAGRPGSHAATEDTLQLDVRQLHRDGYLMTPRLLTWQWGCGATIQLATSPDAVTFTYRYREWGGEWRDVVQRVSITRTPCHYGGSRPWFQCPCCLQRVAILYLWNVPACRKCLKLVYSTQSQDVLARSWVRTRKIESKLAGRTEKWNYYRPKGMRWATYLRLLEAYGSEKLLRDEALVLNFKAHFPDWANFW